ncbi:MAG: methylenetetrahydrofolate reductase C-terminal domain-containing protein, partial [Dehalococcoidia bacterium]|nr:methylenetetrahydrofolate reductase C-terminal domain-containing protein [Dehalococcoidia bacterium]
MIVAEQKSLEEIRRMIEPYGRVLILGCGTCVTVCDAGGEREVSFLHNALRVAQARSGNGTHTFLEYTLKRQCDPEFLDMLTGRVEDVDAILSLGCGIGVQAVAERFSYLPVLPGVNTSFMGMPKEWGIWDERCAACGDCRLGETAGICPITRCTKG